MSGRALLITLAGIITLSATVFLNVTSSSSDISSNADGYFMRQTAQNIAQSGVNMALRQLADNRIWRTGFTMLDVFGGKLTVTLIDTFFTGKAAVKITSTGITNYNRPEEKRATSIAFAQRGSIPPTVKAAITTNNPVKTLGTLIVDGRDHTAAGSLIGGQGTLGIWTTQTLSQSGSSKIGGTYEGTDYAPSKPANPNTIATGQVWPGGYPGTPDSVLGGSSLGFPEGTLKAIAQSGIGGSQYVTNPSLLTFPLQGVTYVELPSGGTWQSMNLDGTGILIVHNNWKNAAMKNLNSGTFTGLLIADDVIHIHTIIIGALVALSPNPSQGNCIGNGSGQVLYSGDAILNATGGIGSSAGGGNGSASGVLAWWE
ncbi:MAG: hypothetical protein HY708_08445 [Ignavibacteriae bacterium]|nr:hypothetical protein [Ignavibacteriota bacterium]